MWLRIVAAYVLFSLLLLGRAAPPEVTKKVTSDQIDTTKIYEPNPPVTHRVLLTVEYFDQVKNEEREQEITIDLYGTVVPKTVENFAKMAHGWRVKLHGSEDPEKVHHIALKGSVFHRIIANSLIQGGDVFAGSLPLSIYGANWPDENFSLKHDRPGRLSMANNGPDTQGSQFFVVTKLEPATEFDMKHVVFGQVVSGLEGLIDNVQYVETDAQDKPTHAVRIKYSLMEELNLKDKEMLHTEYLKKLASFNNGELAEGVSMGSTMANGAEEEEQMDDLRFNDLHHPLSKVIFGLIALLALYVIAKFRKYILPKSSKIVSLRRE